MAKRVLVAGALGVVGRASIEHFTRQPDCEVIALARRKPDFDTPATFVSLDLRDGDACRQTLGAIGDVSHVVFAALHEQPSLVSGWTEAEHITTNLAMLRNTIDGVEASSPSFRHLALMHGGKHYGVHLGPPPRVPSRESDPRAMPPNFYYDQEDFLRERQRGKSWSWTILRPPAVCGFAIGSPMNTLLTVGVFASVCRALGLPLRFPGSPGHLKDVCDAGLLARAVAWAGESDAAANQAFNVANGDVFMWEQVFPTIAEVFGMRMDFPHSLSLGRVMAGKGPVWDRIVAEHGLHPYRFEQLVANWEYADFTFRHRQQPYESVLSTIKIRKAGFHDCVDTEEMFVRQLRALQAGKILPA
jgi:nucleoside-diphosphate-sugar epimerase